MIGHVLDTAKALGFKARSSVAFINIGPKMRQGLTAKPE